MSPKTFHVLFVCTGNSCRSPMAEGILKNMLQKRGIKHIQVSSAGTMAPHHMPPTNYAIITTVEKGVDIASHRSQPLTEDMAESADLILVMENSHKRFVKNLSPLSREKTFLLKKFGKRGRSLEVADPIGSDLEIYRTCCEEMENEILRILPEIIARSHKK